MRRSTLMFNKFNEGCLIKTTFLDIKLDMVYNLLNNIIYYS